MFFRPVPDLAKRDLYRETHPPQVARLDFFMREATGWCRQNRPELQAWMDQRLFQGITSTVVRAIGDDAGIQALKDQGEFLRSEMGTKYIKALGDGIDAYRQAL